MIKNIQQNEALQVCDLHNIKLNLYNVRRKKFSPLPKCMKEV